MGTLRKQFLLDSSTLCLSVSVQAVRFGLAVFSIMECSDSGGDLATLIVSTSWQSTLGASITLCFSVWSDAKSEVVMPTTNILSQILKFAIPYLTVGIVEALCKHRTKIRRITERMVNMTYKSYKRIRNMTKQCTSWIESPFGPLT